MQKNRSVIVTIAALIIGIMPSCVLADDASDIQAVITAYVTKQGIQQPGIFYNYSLVENAPYASVQAGLGTEGYGSESFALAKRSTEWQVILHGGGLMDASLFVTVGIPLANARNLEGARCRFASRKANVSMRSTHTVPRVTQTFLDPNVARMLIGSNKGLPTKRVSVLIAGKRRVIAIMQSVGYSRSCIF